MMQECDLLRLYGSNFYIFLNLDRSGESVGSVKLSPILGHQLMQNHISKKVDELEVIGILLLLFF